MHLFDNASFSLLPSHCLASAPGGELLEKVRDKARVVLEIAFSQPSRLTEQAKHPLKPRAHHPPGRLRFRAGEEVERSPDGEHDCRNSPHVIDHPSLLLRTS